MTPLLWIVFACRPDAPPASTPVAPTDPRGALVFDGELPKNVWMISIDTTRRDMFTRYGGPGATPFLDRLMTEGVVADAHHQCSNWTWHSTSCTLSGIYSEDVGFLPRLAPNPEPLPEQPTLARTLSDAGYATVLTSTNGWLGPKFNNAQGYQLFNPGEGAGTFLLMARAEAGITTLTNGDPELPWFAHSHSLEPHAPYNPPEEYRIGEDELPPLPIAIDTQTAHYAAISAWPAMSEEDQAILEQHLRLRYEGELRWTDAMIEAAFAKLDELGRLDDTLVVVWTDHGEAFWEHGEQTHAHHLYAQENDALLFFWAKNLRPAVWTEPTSGVDVVPTILHALGMPAEGTSGHPLGLAPSDRPIFLSTVARQGAIQGVVKDNWKLLYSLRDDTFELYRRDEDPTDSNNLASVHPDVVAELWETLEPRVLLADELLPDAPLPLP